MGVDLMTFLEHTVVNFVSHDIRNVALYHSRRHRTTNAGHFSVPREVFCCIDFMGYLTSGKNSTQNAVKFIKQYFPQRYQDYAELFYSMWRHGLVHEFIPKTYSANSANGEPGKIRLTWLANNSRARRNREVHLKFRRSKGHPGTLQWSINICSLADDLLVAVRRFKDDVTHDEQKKKRSQEHLNRLYSAREYTEVGKDIRMDVLSQIHNAWKTAESGKWS
jgi:hypothetical protein